MSENQTKAKAQVTAIDSTIRTGYTLPAQTRAPKSDLTKQLEQLKEENQFFLIEAKGERKGLTSKVSGKVPGASFRVVEHDDQSGVAEGHTRYAIVRVPYVPGTPRKPKAPAAPAGEAGEGQVTAADANAGQTGTAFEGDNGAAE